MTSKASNIQAYIDEVPADRRVAIERLRQLCKDNLTGYEECIEYGMPCYKRNGAIEIGFASQKQYIAFYMSKRDVLDEFRTSLSASSIGKGCVRYSKPEKINFDVIEQLLRRNAESASTPC